MPPLAALAPSAWTHGGRTRIVACLDARMREVYVAAYARSVDAWVEVSAHPPCWAPAAVAGPGARAGSAPATAFALYPGLAPQLGLAAVDAAARPTASGRELALPRESPPAKRCGADALPIYVRHRVALTTRSATPAAALTRNAW